MKPTQDQLNHMMLLNLIPGRNKEDEDGEPSFDSQDTHTDHQYQGDEVEGDGNIYFLG